MAEDDPAFLTRLEADAFAELLAASGELFEQTAKYGRGQRR
jgi:hypothetical protein